MKKAVLTLLMLLIGGYLQAQGFSACNASFEEIDSTGTPLHLRRNQVAHISLPFPFTLYDSTSTDLLVSQYGGVFFGRSVDTLPFYFRWEDLPVGFYPKWSLWSLSGAEIYWQIKGTAPNRYLVVEWKNMMMPGDDDIFHVTFELILHEGSNEVEFRYPEEFEQSFMYIVYIQGHDVMFYPDSDMPVIPACLHWSLPQRYPPVAHSFITAECDSARYRVNVVVSDLGGDTAAVLSQAHHNFWVSHVPDTIVLGPFASGELAWYYISSSDRNYTSYYNNIFGCTPPNDECVNAIEVPVNTGIMQCDTSITGTCLGATDSGMGAGLPGVANDDVWFRFTAPSDSVRIRITPSPSNSFYSYYNDPYAMAVYEGNCGSLNLIKAKKLLADDDYNQMYLYHLQAGQTYYLQVYSYYPDKPFANFTICISPFTVPENDNCQHVVDLDTINYEFEVNTHGARHDVDVACLQGTGYRDVLYKMEIGRHEVFVLGWPEYQFARPEGIPKGKYIYLAAGDTCPGDSLILCEPVKRTDTAGLFYNASLLTHWINMSTEPKNVYMTLADSLPDGSKTTMVFDIRCPEPPRPNMDLPVSQTDLDNGTIPLEWNVWDFDVGTAIWWRNTADTTWHLHITPIGVHAYTLTGLPGGAYLVYVGSDCDNTSYDFWEDYFCVSYHAQYTEDFSQNNLPCWKNKTDEYPNWIRDGLGDFWQIGDFPMDATMGQALFSPNPDYFTSDRVWLISPRIEISGPDANLQMDVAAVDSDNRQYITLASNDTVQVLITTDEGQNWTLLHEWSGNQALSGLTHLQEDLSAYDGLYVRFALTVKLASFTPMAPSSTGTKRVYFDNFQVNGTLNSPEASLDNTWRLYPNPAGESLHWKSKIPVLGVQITDLSGKVLMELNKPKENIIFTGNLSPGVYVLRLTTIEGESARYFIKK